MREAEYVGGTARGKTPRWATNRIMWVGRDKGGMGVVGEKDKGIAETPVGEGGIALHNGP